jgi:hypothetical protein
VKLGLPPKTKLITATDFDDFETYWTYNGKSFKLMIRRS